MTTKTRTYSLKLQDVDTFDIETGKKNKKNRYRFFCHGDMVYEWTVLIPFKREHKQFQFKNFKLYINDNLLNNVEGIIYGTKNKTGICKIDIKKIRNFIRNIEMPDTFQNNKLINIENQFMAQSLECLNIPITQNLKVEQLSKQILMDTLFMGGICIEIELNYPLDEITIIEKYHDYISSKLKEKEEERKKRNGDPVDDLFKKIKNN